MAAADSMITKVAAEIALRLGFLMANILERMLLKKPPIGLRTAQIAPMKVVNCTISSYLTGIMDGQVFGRHLQGFAGPSTGR
jgi:hypothetical protein